MIFLSYYKRGRFVKFPFSHRESATWQHAMELTRLMYFLSQADSTSQYTDIFDELRKLARTIAGAAARANTTTSGNQRNQIHSEIFDILMEIDTHIMLAYQLNAIDYGVRCKIENLLSEILRSIQSRHRRIFPTLELLESAT